MLQKWTDNHSQSRSLHCWHQKPFAPESQQLSKYKIFTDLFHLETQMNIFSKRRTARRSINLHKAAQPRGCDSVTVFACLPGLTLHNSRIRHSRFSSGCDPETSWLCNAAQCSYYDTVLVAAHVLRSQPWCQNRPRRHKRGALLNETKGAVYCKLQPPSQANERSWGRRGSAADFQTAIPAPLASMSMGIRVTSLKFSVHYIGLSCSFVSAQYRTTQFNHSMAISWLHKPKWSRYSIQKTKKTTKISHL